MATKKPRPVITIVEARPMSEMGFRSEHGGPPLSATQKPISNSPISPAVRHVSDSTAPSKTPTPSRPAPAKPVRHSMGACDSSVHVPLHQTQSVSVTLPKEQNQPVIPVHGQHHTQPAPLPQHHQQQHPQPARRSPPQRRCSTDSEPAGNGIDHPVAKPRPMPRPRSMIVKPQPPGTNSIHENNDKASSESARLTSPSTSASKPLTGQPSRPTIIGRPSGSHSAAPRPTTVISAVTEPERKLSGMSMSKSAEFDQLSKTDRPPVTKPKPSRMTPHDPSGPVPQPVPSSSQRRPTIIRATSTNSEDLKSANTVMPRSATAEQLSTAAVDVKVKPVSKPIIDLHGTSVSYHTGGHAELETMEKSPDNEHSPAPPLPMKPVVASQKKPTAGNLSKTSTWYTDGSLPAQKKSPSSDSTVKSPSTTDGHASSSLKATVENAETGLATNSFKAPQPKKRPTIIKMGQPSDESETKRTAGTVESAAVHSSSRHQGNHVSTASSPELENIQNHSLELRHGMADTSSPSVQPVSLPVPRARQLPPESHMEVSHSTSLDLSKKHAPSKPPPPKALPTKANDDQQLAKPSNVEESHGKMTACASRPPRPVAGPQHPPARPSQPPVAAAHAGVPSLPQRPSLGHPLYHYVVKGPHALALFNYSGLQSDELSFTAGEIIALEKWVNAEWIVGSTGHGRGMFPVNFVEIVEPLATGPDSSATPTAAYTPVASTPSSSPPSTSNVVVSGPRCIARFDYEAGEPGDLDFSTGDIIRLLEHVNDEWLRGELDGKSGVFPLAFVEILEDLPVPPSVAVTPIKTDLTTPTTTPAKVDNWPPSSSLPSSVAPLAPLKIEAASPKADAADGLVCSPSAAAGPDDGSHFCIAAFDFDGETPDDLSFRVGDRIVMTGRVNADWLKGKLRGREGIFPAAFVDIIKDFDQDLPPRPKVSPGLSSSQRSPSSPPVATFSPTSISPPAASSLPASTVSAVALYDFDGDVTAGDLCFKAGETVSDVHSVSGEWMSGRIGQRTGQFPVSFVQIL